MTLRHPGIRRRLRTAGRRAADTRYRLGVHRLGTGHPGDYREYLREQLDRTLSRRENDPGRGARFLIDEIARREPAASPVLCIGCRNGRELDEFRARGFHDVVGIDIFSQREDIVVMDMHDLSFDDDSFDVVYSSHSLEHAYDVDAVVAEIARVARDGAVVAVEVPVRHHGSDADRVDFAGLDALREPFRPYVREELVAHEDVHGSETNDQGSDVARLVFRLRKERAPATSPEAAVRARSRPAIAWSGVLANVLVLAFVFAVVPELLGDRPYNVV